MNLPQKIFNENNGFSSKINMLTHTASAATTILFLGIFRLRKSIMKLSREANELNSQLIAFRQKWQPGIIDGGNI